jgi:hypothetical protein
MISLSVTAVNTRARGRDEGGGGLRPFCGSGGHDDGRARATRRSTRLSLIGLLASLNQRRLPLPQTSQRAKIYFARSAFAYDLFPSISTSARQRLAQNEPDPSPRASRPLAASLTEQVALWCGRQPRRPLCQCLACQHRRRRQWRRWQGHVCCSGQVSRRYSRLRRREVGKRAQSNS